MLETQDTDFGSFFLLHVAHCYYQKINDTSKVLREKRYDGDEDDDDLQTINTRWSFGLILRSNAIKLNKKAKQITKTHSIGHRLNFKYVNRRKFRLCVYRTFIN